MLLPLEDHLTIKKHNYLLVCVAGGGREKDNVVYIKHSTQHMCVNVIVY